MSRAANIVSLQIRPPTAGALPGKKKKHTHLDTCQFAAAATSPAATLMAV